MNALIFILKITLVISVGLFSAHGQQYKLVCYFSNWSQYRAHPYRYFPRDIDPHLCTHIIYAFGRLSGNAILPYEWNDESTPWSKGHYEQVMDLKQLNPSLKVLLGVGGWTHGSGPFSRMASTDQNIAEFTQNAIAYLRRRNFDGIDFDWEYPGSREGSDPVRDKYRYSVLVRKTREAFETESIRTGGERLLLAAALPAGKSKIDIGYELPIVGRYLDFVNVMSYDYHGQWDDYVGLNAPLYGRVNDEGPMVFLSQNWTLNYYIDNGIPREKVVMGLATYGRSFTLQSSLNTNIGSLAIRGGTRGAYTRESGYLAYYEICQGLQADVPNKWTRQWDDQQFSPYAYWRDQWVGYDDRESTEIKTQYIVANEFGGAMVWELASDDFRGDCNEGTYPLIRTIKSVLEAALIFPRNQTTTPITTTTTKTTATTTPRTTTTSTVTTTTPKLTTTTTPKPTTTTTPQITTTTPKTTTTTTQKSTTTTPKTTTTTTRKTTPTTTTKSTTTLETTTTTTPKSTTTRKTTPTTTPKTTTTTRPLSSTTTTVKTTTQTPTPPTTTCRPSIFFPCKQATTTRRPISNVKPRLNGAVQNFGELCTEAGMLLPYNADCSMYVQCVSVTSPQPVWYVMPCQPGLYFREDTSNCDFPETVPDCPQPDTLSTQVALTPGRGGVPPSIEFTTSPEPTVTSPPYELNKPRTGFDGNTTVELNVICDPGNLNVEYNADCTRYVACIFWRVHYVMPCPYGLYYNKAGYCDWPQNVPECNY